MENKKISLITFDVEEWFQVENLKSGIHRDTWPTRESSVIKNTDKILHILSEHKIQATFFVLGWIAERNPHLVKQISDHGHEIASHGYNHHMTSELSGNELEQDIIRSKKILESITSGRINGYRAPNFSISDRLISILENNQFMYDASFNPFQLHDRYGTISLPLQKVSDTIYQTENGLYEVPVSVISIYRFNLPLAGGAYFRIYPFSVYRKLIQWHLEKSDILHFYLHPWEFEPEQPRIKSIKFNQRLRHYTNLSKTYDKFDDFIRILKEYNSTFLTISDFLRMKYNYLETA